MYQQNGGLSGELLIRSFTHWQTKYQKTSAVKLKNKYSMRFIFYLMLVLLYLMMMMINEFDQNVVHIDIKG